MPKDLICPICGVTQRMQDNAKYCSDNCRQKGFQRERKRKAQRLAEMDMFYDKQEKQDDRG